MNKINFKEFKIPLGIAAKKWETRDVREEIADFIYTKMSGIRAHTLAHKIYGSEGLMELSEKDLKAVRVIFEQFAIGPYIDGLNAQLDTKDE
ncbi:hypothetical protein [Prevotella denticola]|uniref:hypothetical protein n=1 Tax=Prevotella denticola TaxID=28129 RepID=UPI0028DC14B2|nr:hypothetical protein [Prevotella denticola]